MAERIRQQKPGKKQNSQKQALPQPTQQQDSPASEVPESILQQDGMYSESDIIWLQRNIGNEATRDMISSAAPKKVQRMDGDINSVMSELFGEDFDGVKVHTGAEASAITRQNDAEATTIGEDIYFADDMYQPGTEEGNALLAHELTHVAQQRDSGTRVQNSRAGVLPNSMEEREATEVGDIVREIGGTPHQVLQTARNGNPSGQQNRVLQRADSAAGRVGDKVLSGVLQGVGDMILGPIGTVYRWPAIQKTMMEVTGATGEQEDIDRYGRGRMARIARFLAVGSEIMKEIVTWLGWATLIAGICTAASLGGAAPVFTGFAIATAAAAGLNTLIKMYLTGYNAIRAIIMKRNGETVPAGLKKQMLSDGIGIITNAAATVLASLGAAGAASGGSFAGTLGDVVGKSTVYNEAAEQFVGGMLDGGIDTLTGAVGDTVGGGVEEGTMGSGNTGGFGSAFTDDAKNIGKAYTRKPGDTAKVSKGIFGNIAPGKHTLKGVDDSGGRGNYTLNSIPRPTTATPPPLTTTAPPTTGTPTPTTGGPPSTPPPPIPTTAPPTTGTPTPTTGGPPSTPPPPIPTTAPPTTGTPTPTTGGPPSTPPPPIPQITPVSNVMPQLPVQPQRDDTVVQREETTPTSDFGQLDGMMSAIKASGPRIQNEANQGKSSADNVVTQMNSQMGGADEVKDKMGGVTDGFEESKEALGDAETATVEKAEGIKSKSELKKMDSKLDEGLAQAPPSDVATPEVEVEPKKKKSLGSRIKGWFLKKILGIKGKIRKLNAKLMGGIMKFMGKFNDLDVDGFSDDMTGMVEAAKGEQKEEAESVEKAGEYNTELDKLSGAYDEAKKQG